MARIRKSGGYRKLASFQTATIIYDATVWFCLVGPRRCRGAGQCSDLSDLSGQLLLDQQSDALEDQFIDEGGYSEQLATARLQRRSEIRSQKSKELTTGDSTTTDDPLATIPRCPVCSAMMALRTAKNGSHAGSQFWGCTNYPQCRVTVPV